MEDVQLLVWNWDDVYKPSTKMGRLQLGYVMTSSVDQVLIGTILQEGRCWKWGLAWRSLPLPLFQNHGYITRLDQGEWKENNRMSLSKMGVSEKSGRSPLIGLDHLVGKNDDRTLDFGVAFSNQNGKFTIYTWFSHSNLHKNGGFPSLPWWNSPSSCHGGTLLQGHSGTACGEFRASAPPDYVCVHVYV